MSDEWMRVRLTVWPLRKNEPHQEVTCDAIALRSSKVTTSIAIDETNVHLAILENGNRARWVSATIEPPPCEVGLGWTLSPEAQRALDAIDASMRAGAIEFARLAIGCAKKDT